MITGLLANGSVAQVVRLPLYSHHSASMNGTVRLTFWLDSWYAPLLMLSLLLLVPAALELPTPLDFNATCKPSMVHLGTTPACCVTQGQVLSVNSACLPA